ncbi:hypothetical protein BV22DRAFT_1190764 [Leucogyrophana mollusca]|uniref:Uncharacterized protein n=1 Tax=Leucogyrophana mollusca TaxID=85980 RepID=A0ACB8C1P6_9AGAM|nr:hypothetical protein BV22DRAFT_1190764 [Leucogyrophana mollusca]
MRSFALPVVLCAFPLFCLQVFAISEIGSSGHQRPRSVTHKRTIRDLDASNSTLEPQKRGGSSRFTYFADGQGACGSYNQPTDFIVALDSSQFDGGSHCFEMITVTVNGKSTQAQITDECPSCPWGALDFSKGLFEFFAPTSVGELWGDWYYGTAQTTTTSKAPETSTWSPPPTTTTSFTPTTTSTTSTTSSATSSQSPEPSFTPSDPQLLTQLNFVIIGLGSLVQACASVSF